MYMLYILHTDNINIYYSIIKCKPQKSQYYIQYSQYYILHILYKYYTNSTIL